MPRAHRMSAVAPLPQLRGGPRRARRAGTRLETGAEAYAAYERTGDETALDDAVAAFAQAAAAAGPHGRHRCTALANLGAMLGQRAARRDDPAERDRAIELLDRVVGSCAGGRVRVFALTSLGIVLLERRRFDEIDDDLGRAAQVLQEAAAQPDDADADQYARCCNNLGIAASELFLRDGRPEDLDRALTAYEAAVEAVPDDTGDRSSNLATGLAERYGLYGEQDDLDRAIVLMQAAADQQPDDVDRRENLALVLRDRYLRDGDLADLDGSVSALSIAVESAPQGPALAGTLDQLALSLRLRAVRASDPAELRQAVDLQREALALTANDHVRGRVLANLAGSLRALAMVRGDGALLDDAVTALRAAASLTSSLLDRAAILTNLGNALLDRQAGPGSTSTEADGPEAVRVTSESVALTPAESPALAGRLNNLGLALERAYESTGQPRDLADALASFRSSSAAAAGTSAPDRLRTAQNWCRLALRAGQWEEAYDALPEIRVAADDLLSINLERAHRISWLAAVDGAAADAAYVTLRVDRADEAVEWLEWPRTKLALAAYGRDYGQLVRLSTSQPSLADRYRQVVGRIRSLESLAAET